jgi:TRAP-type transport system periplasmic protein
MAQAVHAFGWRWLGVLLLSVFLCGVSAAAEIKLASIAPDGSHWMRQMREGAEQIRERTAGRVELKFYPGGVMGNDAQVLRKIRIGQLHGGAFTAGGLAQRYPALNLYGMPLLFRSLDEVDYVRERIDPKLEAGLEAAGFVSFGFSEGGFANLMAKQPIRSIEDLLRKKVWVPEGDQISFRAMEALGLSPVVLPVTDVLTGLQTGLLDVVAASPVAALVLQWHTKISYRTELPVSYSMGVFAIEKRTYDRLEAADQRVIEEVMTGVMSGIDTAARDDNRQARRVLADSGVQPVQVETANVDDWRRTIEDLYPEYRRRADVDAELFDELLDVLAEYRASHPGASGGD